MKRLHITAEGQTEERFVNDCLVGHLASFGVYADVRTVLTSEDNRKHVEYRGGFRRKNAYSMVKKDITNWLKEDRDLNCFFTTMFDYYALPVDFPGFAEAQTKQDKYERIQTIETALKLDINDPRFIPYIQLHEFETLIFVDPQALDWEYIEHEEPIAELINISREYDNPELINDSPLTAPSKRIISLIPEYAGNKISGAIVAQKIGIQRLMARCRHFSSWLQTLESLDE